MDTLSCQGLPADRGISAARLPEELKRLRCAQALRDPQTIRYQAESPDESALVVAAKVPPLA